MDMNLNRNISLNVAGLTSPIKRKRIAKFLRKERAQFICIQETPLKKSETSYLKQIFKGSVYHAHSTTRSSGIAIGIHSNPFHGF